MAESRARHARVSRRASPTVLERINPDAAGIDCGGTTHVVAVPSDRDAHPVQSFRTFTTDLHRLADWLVACRVTTVALESTGVFWIPVYEILEARGLTVQLVSHVRNLPGRKSDVSDAEWLRDLHSITSSKATSSIRIRARTPTRPTNGRVAFDSFAKRPRASALRSSINRLVRSSQGSLLGVAKGRETGESVATSPSAGATIGRTAQVPLGRQRPTGSEHRATTRVRLRDGCQHAFEAQQPRWDVRPPLLPAPKWLAEARCSAIGHRRLALRQNVANPSCSPAV
jgi:transposase